MSDPVPSTMSAEEMTKMLLSLSKKLDTLTSDGDQDSSESRKRSREDEDHDEDKTALEESEGSTKKQRTFNVSSPTKAFMKTSFCLPKPVENATRRAWLEKFGLPEGDEARCPKMDPLVKGELGKDIMEANKRLARLQNFTLDATGSLVTALEELTAKEPDGELVIAAIQQGLTLIGNASAHFSKERRSRALEKLNPDLKSLAEDEDFSDSQPLLFGKSFEKKAKERAEALECLRKATNKDKSQNRSSSFPQSSSKRFFRGNRPQQYGGNGGGNYHRQTNWNTERRTPYYKRTTEKPNGPKKLKENESRRLNSVNKSIGFPNKVIKPYYATGQGNNRIKGLGKERTRSPPKSFPVGEVINALPELGKNNQGSMDLHTNKWSRTRIDWSPTTGQNPGGNTNVTGYGTTNVDRDRETDSKGCSSPGRSHKGVGFCIQNVPGPQEGRILASHNRPPEPEQIYPPRTFQDGGNSPDKRPLTEGRLVHKDRSEGCIFRNPDPQTSPQIPRVSMGGEIIPIQLPPIRPFIGPTNLHKDYETNKCMVETARVSPDQLYRRQSSSSQIQGGSSRVGRSSSLSPGRSRLRSKLRKVNPQTNPIDRISGFLDQF